jgi:hypothetical protein
MEIGMSNIPPSSNGNFITPYSLDDYFQSTPIGSVNRAIGNSMYGINHRQIPGMVSSNMDLYGLTFFTRPQLNLQSDNIRNVRQMYPLLTDISVSIQRFVRATLDPRMLQGFKIYGKKSAQTHTVAPIVCPILDNKMAFIPVLTNNLTSMSGWPDMVSPVYSSKNGLYNQSFSQVDGSIKYFEAFDLSATFRNTRGDTILYMFYIWLWYQSLVFEGYLIPYPDFVVENEIDYNTRIYRLVLDITRTYVKKISATGASFPISVPMGSFFDFDSSKPYNDQNKDFTVQFKCNGATYQDDILVKEFNMTTVIFNPEMKDSVRSKLMTKVDKSLLQYFNNRGYPYIDPNTYELQWFVDNTLFNNRYSAMKNLNLNVPDNNTQIYIPHA